MGIIQHHSNKYRQDKMVATLPEVGILRSRPEFCTSEIQAMSI